MLCCLPGKWSCTDLKNVMDEVFGNSSTETVMEAELCQVLETIHHDLASLHQRHSHKPSAVSSNTTSVPQIANPTQPKLPPSHIKFETINHMKQPTAAPRPSKGKLLPVFKGTSPHPYPRATSETASFLRHTKSAVDGWISPAQDSLRPRAFSVNASSQHHSYVNVHTCCPASSSANNVPGVAQPARIPPLPHTTTLPKYVNLPLSPQPSSSSAPSTPHRENEKQCIHHSYIELWTGMKEERDSLSDSECEGLKQSLQEPQTPTNQSSPGYVQMTSPFVKSPHVTSSLNGSVLANFASKLASYAGQQPRSIFCPFCPRYFSYEKSLSSHIHKTHRIELNSMVTNACSDLKLQFCPICQAQFFNTSVLPKHLVDFHRASVIEVLEKSGCILSDAMGIHCPFCTRLVPHNKTGEEVLLYHIQQLHFSDFSAMIGKNFQPFTAASFESLKSQSLEVLEAGTFQPKVTSTPGLSNRLGTMTLSVEALNLDSTWSSHTGAVRSPPIPPSNPTPAETLHTQAQLEDRQEGQHLAPSPSKGILRHQNSLSRKPSVKRELRFSVPPVTSEEVFFQESPEPSVVEPLAPEHPSGVHHQHDQACIQKSNKLIPVRVDSLSTADFLDLTAKTDTQRKRRRLGLGLHSRKAFKKRDKENIGERGLNSLVNEATKMVDCGKKQNHIICPGMRTQGTRTFRRPKPVAVPCVPKVSPAVKVADNGTLELLNKINGEEETYTSHFTNMKLYSPLRMFRCNNCRVKFCDNESLSSHISMRHKGLLHILRPHYGCGVCSAKFFENKYLVKHCLQHHTSLLEIRSPHKQKVAMYRFTHD